jgi:penicillin-binding protein 1A
MWDIRPPRKPFYRRAWFLVPLFLLFAAVIAGTLVFLYQKEKWEKRAQALDYRQLDDMESASIIYDRSGAVIGRIFIQNRDQVPFNQLPSTLVTAVIAAEDARFYQHHGVDLRGIIRAMVVNVRSKRARQGASTITQQLARNTFPEELPANDRSYERKIYEMFVAREIEKRCNKEKILELYLNRVFFGSGFYGAEAAARGYFGKRARDLDLSEAATLAGLLRSPSNLSPWRNRRACVEQRNYVLQRAREVGLIDKPTYEETMKQDLIVKNRRPIHQESYAADLVAQQVEKLVGRDSAVSDGYRIYTTIDLELQKKAETVLREQLNAVERHEGYEHPLYADYDRLYKGRVSKPANGDSEPPPLPAPEYLQGSVVILDNATGGLLALIGGRNFQHSEYDRALVARRPVGTAFTPFVFAAGFEQGLFPGTIVQDTVIDNRQVMIGGLTGILGEWGPERVDNKYEGAISAREALVKGKNAATVRFGMSTGLEKITDFAKRAGVESPLRPFPATYLGSSECTLMEMTLATAIFPGGGTRPARPFIIQRIEEKSGRVLFSAKPEKTRACPAPIAYQTHSCLAEVLERGTADRAFTELGLKKFPLGGKTGTAYNFTDDWFLGYSSEVTCGVWVGFDKPQTIYRGAFSNEVALPIWAKVIGATFANYRPQEIAMPAGVVKAEICAASGELATPRCVETAQNKDTGESISRRTTYFEIGSEKNLPKNACAVHNGGVSQSFLKVIPGAQWPRATAAVNVAEKAPVVMKGPTVIGESDPYNSVLALNNAFAAKALDGQVAPLTSSAEVPAPAPVEGNQPEVRRAAPVAPAEQMEVQESAIKLDPPEPIKF